MAAHLVRWERGQLCEFRAIFLGVGAQQLDLHGGAVGSPFRDLGDKSFDLAFGARRSVSLAAGRWPLAGAWD
jgi:hypothetical protein